MHKIEFLPIALEDLRQIVRYISVELKNPVAAEKIADEIIEKINRLEEFPYIAHVYIPQQPLEKEYRKLLVKNYSVFYTVEEETKTVTISRVLYNKRQFQ